VLRHHTAHDEGDCWRIGRQAAGRCTHPGCCQGSCLSCGFVVAVDVAAAGAQREECRRRSACPAQVAKAGRRTSACVIHPPDALLQQLQEVVAAKIEAAQRGQRQLRQCGALHLPKAEGVVQRLHSRQSVSMVGQVDGRCKGPPPRARHMRVAVFRRGQAEMSQSHR